MTKIDIERARELAASPLQCQPETPKDEEWGQLYVGEWFQFTYGLPRIAPNGDDLERPDMDHTDYVLALRTELVAVLPALLDELEAARRVVEAAAGAVTPLADADQHYTHEIEWTTAGAPAKRTICRAAKAELSAALTAYRAATTDTGCEIDDMAEDAATEPGQ